MKKTDKPGCIIPFNGLTLGPSGDVLLCCVSSAFPLAHIDDIPDLQTFFESEIMNHKRSIQYSNEVKNDNACGRCYKNPHQTTWAHREDFKDWYNFGLNEDLKIKYLEFSTSNLCNQNCVMCGPKFSSKWQNLSNELSKYGFEYGYLPTNRLSEANIKKIIKVLPHLEVINIKGGEPFADPTNFKILEELTTVNKNCRIEIISNLQNIPDNILSILQKIPKEKLSIGASIDGIDFVYEWIRGSNFAKTVDTMEKIYLETGHDFSLNPVTSIHNFFTGDKIANYFVDKLYVRSIKYDNPVRYPYYCDHLYLPRDIYYNKIDDYYEISKMPKVIVSSPILHPIFFNDVEQHKYDKIFRYIDSINKIRGIDLYKHTPELVEVRNRVLQ